MLAKTPELLPVLKQAGVVDSGGQGLMQVVKGAVDQFFSGLGAEGYESGALPGTEEEKLSECVLTEAETQYGYSAEFVIVLEKSFPDADELELKAFLESIGDSLNVEAMDSMVQVHVHTNDPGLALTKALTYGALSRIKIENLREELIEKRKEEAEKAQEESTENGEDSASVSDTKPAEAAKPYGFIAVSIGEGINKIFAGLNVDYIIEGGQTMNPSTEDMLNAIDRVNAETIYILPNNSNIILAADQAMHMTEDKRIVVVPSRTIPQGITALITFQAELSPDENLEAMKEAMKHVKTGQVTYAVRNTCVDDQEIHEGDIMGIGDHSILAVGCSVPDVTLSMLDKLVDEDSELISIYYGCDTSEEDAQRLADRISEKYSDQDVELYPGGQPIYYYFLSVE